MKTEFDYIQLKKRHSDLFGKFPIAFAFSAVQLEDAKEKLKVKTTTELFSIHGGGLIRKADLKDYKDLLILITNEENEAMKDDKYLLQGFIYEMGNHEYCVTYEAEETLDCFGLTIDEVEGNKRLKRIWVKARDLYLSTAG